MTKWVYLTVCLRMEWNNHKQLCVVEEDDQKIPSKPILGEYLSQLGAQGWELVTVDGCAYIFKRPQ